MTTRHRVTNVVTVVSAAFIAGLLADATIPVSIAIGGIVGVAWAAGRASGWIAASRHTTPGSER